MATGGAAPLPILTSNLIAPVTSLPSPREQAEAHFRISFARARQKRGPPALL